MKKYIALSIISLVVTVIAIIFLVSINTAPEKKDSLTIVTNQKYNEGIALYTERKYEEALEVFQQLENNETSMHNLAHLNLKKIQIALAKKDYSGAVRELESLVNNPQFPAGVRSRGMENIFTYYFASNQDEAFYKAIFSSPTFAHLAAATSSTQSIYNYAEYGYKLYPTTIFGASIIYGKLDRLDKSSSEMMLDLKKMTEIFFSNSNSEIENLKAFSNQETTLLNIYTERARVLHKTGKLIGKDDIKNELEEQLYLAVQEARNSKDKFYIFYTTYNYIDYAANSAIVPREEMTSAVTDHVIFDIKNVPESWYRVTIKNTESWSLDRKNSVERINPILAQLIEYYK